MVDLEEKSVHVLYPIANKPPQQGRSLQVQHSLLLQLQSPTGHITGPWDGSILFVRTVQQARDERNRFMLHG